MKYFDPLRNHQSLKLYRRGGWMKKGTSVNEWEVGR